MDLLQIALIDANEKANKQYAGQASSVVSGWLTWEVTQAGLAFCKPSQADIVFLVYAGALDWLAECRAYIKRSGVEVDAKRRRGKPYIIAGGPCDAIPFTVLSVADAMAVGEAYNFVRQVLDRVNGGCTLDELQAWIVEYPHAIERSQIDVLRRDKQQPWLLADPAPKLASPDPWIDWSVPPVRSDDKVVRIIAEKGCHCKCLFCATTYRQTHKQNMDADQVLGTLQALKVKGERVQIVSNDPMALPYFRRISTKLDSQSFTIMEVSDDANRRALIRSGVGIARFGVEGISERIRKAFAKPIANDKLLSILAELHANKINTHLFFIVGAPFEDASDWSEFRLFYERLSRTIRSGICRIKFTTFVNTPPAPLARYVPGTQYAEQMDGLRAWIAGNAASRHLIYVRGRGIDSHLVNVAEQLSVSVQDVARFADNSGTVDLLPTDADAQRAIWEIVDWPISAKKRWRMADIYQRRMTGVEPVLLGSNGGIVDNAT
jgi:hypothetical protein